VQRRKKKKDPAASEWLDPASLEKKIKKKTMPYSISALYIFYYMLETPKALSTKPIYNLVKNGKLKS